ncbi:rubrerythrin-like domain-containing protein [Halobaculum sp. CBA1158]|nr:rubrerythrin-like domain-containing protein [Halobaculum sp. CBA1158]UIO99219.1 rubrerythrin-like domain-containing protein [Halobaculum sp. CBA1158]
MPAIDIDPHSSTEGLFECIGCGSRVRSANHPGTCPNCEADLRNIAVPRE